MAMRENFQRRKDRRLRAACGFGDRPNVRGAPQFGREQTAQRTSRLGAVAASLARSPRWSRSLARSPRSSIPRRGLAELLGSCEGLSAPARCIGASLSRRFWHFVATLISPLTCASTHSTIDTRHKQWHHDLPILRRGGGGVLLTLHELGQEVFGQKRLSLAVAKRWAPSGWPRFVTNV